MKHELTNFFASGRDRGMARFLRGEREDVALGSNSAVSCAESRATVEENPGNHAVITPKSPGNHPLLPRFWKVAATILMVLTMGIGNAWGAYTELFTVTGPSSNDLTQNNVTVSTSNSIQSKTFNGQSSTSVYKIDSKALSITSTTANITKVSFTACYSSSGTSLAKSCKVSVSTDGSTYETLSSGVSVSGGTGTSATNSAGIYISGYGGKTTVTVEFSSAYRYVRIEKDGKETWVNSLSVYETAGGGTPTHSVSAITSTGDNTYGTVSAAASTVAEGATTTITASPATGYRVTNWAVSGTGASISPSGESNANSTTLTMGTADATVTVTFGAIPTHDIVYTNTKDMDNSANPTSYYEGVGVVSFAKLRHAVGYDFTGWSPSSISSSATTNQTIDAQWTANAVAEGTGTLTYALGYSDNTITTSSITRDNGALYDATDLAWTGVTIDESESAERSGKITTTNSYDSEKYLSLTFKIADGYTFTPTEVQLKAVAVSTDKTIRFEFTDNAETPNTKYLEQVRANGSSVGTLTYDFDASDPVTLTGTVTVKIYAYGATNSWRLGTPITITGTVAEAAAPESSDCSAFEFHYGPEIGDWETACFTQVGETNEWRIADFTVPSTANYYVGYHGDGVNGWNSTWSATKSWTDSYSEGNGAMVLLPGTSAVGQATGAQGTLIIWSNSGDKNKYVGFKPNGYGITYDASSHAFAATATANVWETEVVTLPAVSTTYTMGLATVTEGTYVACAHSAAAEAISNMGVTNVGNGKKKIYLVPGSFDVGNVEEKYAVYDVTNNAFDTDFMTDSDGDGVYEGYVGSTCTSIVLCRMSDVATVADLESKNWDGARWNQTGNIAISGTLAKKYTITSLDGYNCAYTETSVQPATGQKGKFRMYDNSSSQNWYVNFVPYYTLSYNGNGGTGSTAATERNSESSTLTVTVAANGFTAPAGKQFAGWAISKARADEGTVDYEAGDDYTLTADATLYAVWESNCPTTGTLFTLSNVGSGYSNNSDAETELTNITLSGGTAYGYGTSDRALEYKSNKIKYNGNANYIKLVLDCPLQVGDEISVTCDEGTGLNFNTDPSTGLGSNGSHPTYVLNGGTYEVKAEDGIIGESTIICWRRTSNGTNVTAITITRPIRYDVTYYKNDGTETSTLAEDVTKVAANEFVRSGYQFTGWNTDPAGEGTAYAVGASLSSDLSLYAQWEQLYTITTGSPANGTVEADKSSAVAGATITLTATSAEGYKLKAWDVYKTGEPATKVSVTNNQFTMPAYGVTVDAEFIESVVLYDYSVMENKSFTDETVTENVGATKNKTFGTEGNPQLVVTNAGWDAKGNIINSFIKFFGGTSGMSIVIPTGRKATVTIKYGSYDANGKYLLVDGVAQAKPIKALDNDITTSNFGDYMRTVELTNQTGTLVLTASTGNIYIAYVDVTLTGYASYGITYHLNDGAWDGDAGVATYTYGTGVASLATNVTKNGYDFAGWYGNEELEGDAITSIANNVTGDKELWAKWTPKSYTLTWSWNGGTCSGVAGTNYTAGGSVAFGTALVYPEASMMSKDGAAFAGWSSTPATMPAEALTITAQWAPEHSITYTGTKGATNSNPETYVEGVGVDSFEPLADVANFHFTGWSPASISNEATTDQTIEAQWVAAYNVSFSAGEGSGTVPATFQKWATATFELPGQGEMVAPTGKVFVGWKANGAGDTRAAGYEYTMTAAAVEFVAQWKAVTLLINYDGENYSLNTDNFVITGATLDGTEYTVDSKTFEKNFQFGGTMGSSGAFAGQTWTNKYLAYDVTSNSTEIKVYLYNKNGSNKKFYYQIVYEGASAGSLQTPSITGQATDQVITISVTAAKGARVLFGVESTDVRICQIEVEENGTALPAFGTNGYEFSIPGRAGTTSKVGSFDGFSFKTYNDIKLISGIEYLSLRANNGDEYIRFTIDNNIQLKVTETNGKKFYVCTSTTGGTVDDTQYGGTSGTHNINLHAGTYNIVPVVSGSSGELKITKLAFATAPGIVTVTFNSNEGSAVAAQELFAGEKAVVPTAPTKSGYRFVEWQLSESAYDFDDEVTEDITLDAVWQKVWTVTFNSDGGSDVDAAVVDDGSAVAAPDPAPEKAGNEFAGWYYGDPAAEYNFAALVTADLTLTAHWTPLDDDASISALAYNGNAIELAEGEEIDGVMTFNVLLPWGETPDKDLISVTKSAESATVGTISYESESKTASFTVTAGDHTTTADYAIVFANDVKKGASIIKATTNNVVTGLIGGSIDQSYSGTAAQRKLDKNTYFGIQLAEGNFQEGDVLIINITTAADLGKFMVYADAARTELLADQGVTYTKPDAASPVVCPTGEMRLVLPAAVDGHNALYLSRENGNTQWNVTFSSLEVTREINPIIKSFKFGDDAATIDEEHKTISIDVPYGTDVTALTPTIEAYGNNGATYTPEGEQDFSSPVNYTVTDGYSEFNTTYAVTVNVADPSENAYLASLSVAGYTLDFDKEVTSYDVVLDYGTTALPAISYEVEDTGLAEAEKVEGGVNGATTITVTPQAGAGYEKVYTINFSVSTTPKYVIYDGSKMTTIAESGSDVGTGFAWTMVGGKLDGNKTIDITLNGKTYTTSQNIFGSPTTSDTRYIEITIPEGYLAKFYLAGATNSNGNMRSSFISKEKTSTLDESIAYASSDQYSGAYMESDYQFPGTYYYCSDASIRLYELSVTLYHIDYSREVNPQYYGTICLPKAGVMVGATIYQIAYMDYKEDGVTPYKVYYDEVEGDVMEAGMPYIFLAEESMIAVTYTGLTTETAKVHNGLHGTLENMVDMSGTGIYMLYNNQVLHSTNPASYLNANRAYLQISEIPGYNNPGYVPEAPTRRRIATGFNGANSATDLENVQGDNVQCTKVLIDGKIYILRGEKMYDVTGKAVK